MATYEIKDSIVAELLGWGDPFKDDVNAVLRKVLDAAKQARAGAEATAVTMTAVRPTDESTRRRKRPKTSAVLLDAGILRAGTELVLFQSRFPVATEIDLGDRRFQCRISDEPRSRNNVVWAATGEALPLSRLTEKLRADTTLPFTGGALNGFGWWALASDPETSLWDLAERLGR